MKAKIIKTLTGEEVGYMPADVIELEYKNEKKIINIDLNAWEDREHQKLKDKVVRDIKNRWNLIGVSFFINENKKPSE